MSDRGRQEQPGENLRPDIVLFGVKRQPFQEFHSSLFCRLQQRHNPPFIAQTIVSWPFGDPSTVVRRCLKCQVGETDSNLLSYTIGAMAKVKQPSIIEEFGAIGDRVYYTHFGKTFSCRRPTQINDQKSKAKLRQRALFKATNTAYIPTLSPDEKRTEKKHRNIDRRVSPPVYIGAVIVA